MSSFSCIKQHDAMQCGIACLAMVCLYYGKRYSLATLSQYCPATMEGVSLLSISETAEQLKLHTVFGHTDIKQLDKTLLPCILHWDQNHFVVLYKIKKSKYYIADPGKGLIKYGEDEFKKHWVSMQCEGEERGVVMFMEPTSNFYKNKSEKASFGTFHFF